ncbi:MAG: hypothetical protein LKI53_02015 [Bacteroidales bacterium]|jgi:hypothetical protein|nr:hypothetical protein [Bacteroidales bacterium]
MLTELTGAESLAVYGGTRDDLTAKAVRLIAWGLGYVARATYMYTLFHFYEMKLQFTGGMSNKNGK